MHRTFGRMLPGAVIWPAASRCGWLAEVQVQRRRLPAAVRHSGPGRDCHGRPAGRADPGREVSRQT